jgi:hypothetical protein
MRYWLEDDQNDFAFLGRPHVHAGKGRSLGFAGRLSRADMVNDEAELSVDLGQNKEESENSVVRGEVIEGKRKGRRWLSGSRDARPSTTMLGSTWRKRAENGEPGLGLGVFGGQRGGLEVRMGSNRQVGCACMARAAMPVAHWPGAAAHGICGKRQGGEMGLRQ